MEIQFKNDSGTVRFLGYGRGGWRLIDVTGLGIAPRSFETVSYSNEAGQKTLSITPGARTITVSAEVNAGSRNARAAAVSRAIRILSKPGELTVRTFRERCAKCCLGDMQEGERSGNFRRYALQFICDSPYFTDVYDTVVPMYERTDLLRDNFVIGDGVILTKRIAGGRIVNDGDEICEGVLTLAASGAGEADVVITNSAAGGAIKLHVGAGHTYKIDLEERTITDEEGRSALNILADESYLSDFYIAVGENEVKFTHNGGDGFFLTAQYTYRRKYTEATD